MGYAQKKFPVITLSLYDSLIIELDEKAFDLPMTTIQGLSAKEIIHKAIKNLEQNFADTNLLLQSFYRQYHKEDDHYVRLIEAIVITEEQPYINNINFSKSEKQFLKALRRSDVMEINKAQHGDHLMDLLNENPFKFPTGSVLNLRGIDYFNFHFAESNSLDEIVIEFTAKVSSADQIQNGLIYIDEKTFVINRMIIETFPNPNSKTKHFAAQGESYLWKFRNGRYEISFRQLNGQPVFDRITKSYTHYLIDAKVHSLAHIVEENFELQSVKIIGNDSTPFHFSSTSNLYSQNYFYHDSVWINFPLLPVLIKADLEKSIPLKEQFIRNGK